MMEMTEAKKKEFAAIIQAYAEDLIREEIKGWNYRMQDAIRLCIAHKRGRYGATYLREYLSGGSQKEAAIKDILASVPGLSLTDATMVIDIVTMQS